MISITTSTFCVCLFRRDREHKDKNKADLGRAHSMELSSVPTISLDRRRSHIYKINMSKYLPPIHSHRSAKNFRLTWTTRRGAIWNSMSLLDSVHISISHGVRSWGGGGRRRISRSTLFETIIDLP